MVTGDRSKEVTEALIGDISSATPIDVYTPEAESIVDTNTMSAKKSKSSKKERSTDYPDWIDKEYEREDGESIDDFLIDVMNDKFGEGEWEKGPGSDYNKYRKNNHRDNKNPNDNSQKDTKKPKPQKDDEKTNK